MDAYTIRPRTTRDGFNLESDRLSHGGLWYRGVEYAISYARWHSRVKGGKVEVLNEAGEITTTEIFKPGDFAY